MPHGRRRGPSCNAILYPWSPSRAATQELALLISRMQANADQVERDILETQKRLQQVRTLHQGLGGGGRAEAQSQCLEVPRRPSGKRDRQPA